MGNLRVRKILYMCSWAAKKNNKQAIEMYERLKKNGKPERVKGSNCKQINKNCFCNS